MIRPLRQIHRRALPLLLVALLPLLTLALRQRGPEPDSANAPIAASIRFMPASGAHRQIEVRLPADLPEVLVYWLPPGRMDLDASAILIGRPSGPGSLIDLPDPLHEGQLLLYSLPLRQVIDRQRLTDGVSP